MSTTHTRAVLLATTAALGLLAAVANCNFYNDFDITWGGNDGHAKILNGGHLLTLSMDKSSGSGFRSKKQYLFGKIDMQIKFVPGNSAGTVTTYYLSSLGSTHDEIDFEFLGNLSGQPYTVHTNVYTQGKGGKEQQFHLWFDPTTDFHTYSIEWNPSSIVFYVDGTPIRQFKNLQSYGVGFPSSQPMWLYSTLWDAEDWATRGGLVKTDWSRAPFTAAYRNFASAGPSTSQSLDAAAQARLKWVQQNFMIYNYCTDTKRFPQGFPKECSL